MNKLVSILCLVVLVASCSNKNVSTKQKQLATIDSIEKILYKKAATEAINIKDGDVAVHAYMAFVDSFPNDSLALNYLFKAGEVANAIKHHTDAITYFERFVKFYPTHTKAPAALFLQAFICENNLSRLGQASTIYTQVINQYPKTQFAKDAEACINNLGKSPDELIKEFEEKNKKMNQ